MRAGIFVIFGAAAIAVLSDLNSHLKDPKIEYTNPFINDLYAHVPQGQEEENSGPSKGPSTFTDGTNALPFSTLK